MKFIELQNLLRDELRIEHLADIARELGVSPQAVSNWKSRDRVPYKYVQFIRQKFSQSDTLINNQTENNASDSNQVSAQYGYTQHFEEDTISLADILLILANQLKIILITPTIICIYTIIYVLFFVDPVYESTSKIMSLSGGNNSSQAAGIAAQFGINLPTSQSEREWAYLEIIKSRTLAKIMLKRKFDTQKYGPQKSLLQILTYGDKKPEFGLDTLEIIAVNSFLSMIKLSEDPKFSIYTITISASEPNLASELNAALIEELDAHQQEYNKAKTGETKQFIEDRIFDTERALQNAEEALKNFRDRNRRIENSPSLLLEQQRLSREVAVLTGVFTVLKQQLETTKIEEVKESSYVVVLDPPETPLQRSKPKKKRIVFMAGFFGLGLGCLLGYIKDYFENNKKKEREKIFQIKSMITRNINNFLPLRFKKK